MVEFIQKKLGKLNACEDELAKLQAERSRNGGNSEIDAAIRKLEDQIAEGVESPQGHGRLRNLALRPALDVAGEVEAFLRAARGELLPSLQPDSQAAPSEQDGASQCGRPVSFRDLQPELLEVLKGLYAHRGDGSNLVNVIGKALLHAGIATVEDARRLT